MLTEKYNDVKSIQRLIIINYLFLKIKIETKILYNFFIQDNIVVFTINRSLIYDKLLFKC